MYNRVHRLKNALGEAAQWLKALATPGGDPGLVPITDMVAHNHL